MVEVHQECETELDYSSQKHEWPQMIKMTAPFWEMIFLTVVGVCVGGGGRHLKVNVSKITQAERLWMER